MKIIVGDTTHEVHRKILLSCPYCGKESDGFLTKELYVFGECTECGNEFYFDDFDDFMIEKEIPIGNN